MLITKIENIIKSPIRFARKIRFKKRLSTTVDELRKSNGRIAFIMATPCHGNLGDHAIVRAEHMILKECGFDSVEISNYEYLSYKHLIRRFISNEDLIVIDGGGNLGTLWKHEDDKISEIISQYKDNKIVIFPETCFYDDTDEANERLVRNREIYKNASQLNVFLRDERSYMFFKENFPETTAMLVPDSVLYFDEYNYDGNRDKCLICFRRDLEKSISDDEHRAVTDYLHNIGIKYSAISTLYPGNISAAERDIRLKEFFGELASAKLVITDRLHCMLFCAICNTPCLALDNMSKKVSGVGKWIKELKYISVCNSVEELIGKIEEYSDMTDVHYGAAIKEEFSELIQVLNNESL